MRLHKGPLVPRLAATPLPSADTCANKYRLVNRIHAQGTLTPLVHGTAQKGKNAYEKKIYYFNPMYCDNHSRIFMVPK